MRRCPQYFLALLSLAVLISGCVESRAIKLPPVTEGWHKSSAIRNAYIVQKLDTLYSIAWAFGVDYRDLANINNLHPPYILRSGQRLYITSPSKSIKQRMKSQREFAPRASPAKPLLGWIWSASGKIASSFNTKLGGNKGVDIAGFLGMPILACNHGTVVYSGEGIRSYGKLIIIKHNDDYLSAYAYNQHIFVTEGQKITTGQKIATMGKDNEGRAILHFEIRRFGKPVNPLIYLPKKLRS